MRREHDRKETSRAPNGSPSYLVPFIHETTLFCFFFIYSFRCIVCYVVVVVVVGVVFLLRTCRSRPPIVPCPPCIDLHTARIRVHASRLEKHQGFSILEDDLRLITCTCAYVCACMRVTLLTCLRVHTYMYFVESVMNK